MMMKMMENKKNKKWKSTVSGIKQMEGVFRAFNQRYHGYKATFSRQVILLTYNKKSFCFMFSFLSFPDSSFLYPFFFPHSFIHSFEPISRILFPVFRLLPVPFFIFALIERQIFIYKYPLTLCHTFIISTFKFFNEFLVPY